MTASSSEASDASNLHDLIDRADRNDIGRHRILDDLDRGVQNRQADHLMMRFDLLRYRNAAVHHDNCVFLQRTDIFISGMPASEKAADSAVPPWCKRLVSHR